jgi:hypothetical protein
MIARTTRVAAATVFAIAALAAFSPRRSHATSQPTTMRAGIEAALARSVTGWNSGNLTDFMAVYLDADRTSYATKTAYIHGRAAIAARYTSDFAPGAARNTLRLERIDVDSLAPAVAEVMAFYVLTVHDSTIGHGPTSLVMERVGGTWYIVHDHSG